MSDTSIAERLDLIRGRIADAAAGVGRDPAAIRLVAVSKTQDAATIALSLSLGLTCFGENRVQEAEAKFPALRALEPSLDLRLIGPLQTNKVAAAVATFDAIDSLDRAKLAHALAAEMQATGRHLPVLVQVNTGEEPQKAGVTPAELPELLALAQDLGLDVRGLMCIPPVDEEPALHFALLAKLADRHRLAERSMGMSSDYEIAVAFGATMLRLGSALFGAR